MNKETLRMQMLAGVITESEYKAKLEEAEPGNLMLSNAAKQIYQYIKSNKYDAMLQIDGKVIGANKNAPFTLYSDSKSGKISVRGIGSDQNTVKDTMTKLQNLILGHFNFLEKDGEIQVNFDGMKNASLGSFALRIKPDMLKKGEVTEALNEHYVAGGIVGIGAINQIPPRKKAVYEDAFEHFLGQKYGINEAEANIDPAIKNNPAFGKLVSYLKANPDEAEELKDKEDEIGDVLQNVNEAFRKNGKFYSENAYGDVKEVDFKTYLKEKGISIGLPAAALGLLGALIAGPLGTNTPNEIIDAVLVASGIGATVGAIFREDKEVNEAKISPDNAVAYLENTLEHVWNMGTGKNNIDLQSLAQSIAQDLGLIEDLEEGKKPGTFKERSAMAKKARAGKDIGEKGKNFEKIAKSAAKKYGSEEAGKKVAGAVMYGKLNK